MEIRKVQVTGGSSFVISLPKTWASSLKIKKNDPLGIVIQPNGTLLITPKINEEKTQRAKEFNVDKISDPKFLFRYLVAAYVSGYTIIKIKATHSIPPAIRASVRRFTRMTIGQEIVEETPSSITIKDILNPSEMPFENTLRRMYIIVKSMHQDAFNVLNNRDKTLAEDVISRDDDVDRLQWLIGHQQNLLIGNINATQKMGTTTKTIANYFLMSRIIERIGDHAVKIAKNMIEIIDKKVNEKITDKLLSANKLSLKIFDKSMESFTRKDIEEANINIENLKKLTKLCEEIITLSLKEEGKTAVSISYIVESIKRTGEYSADLSEYVIDHLIKEK